MHTLRRIYNIIKGFLSEFSGKEFLIFLFFLALSGIFWLMMTLNETYEVEYKVPLTIAGVPKNVVMTSEPSDTVRVTVKDKGFIIMTYSLYHKFKPLTIRFSAYANTKTGHGAIPLADMMKMTRQQIYGSSSLTSLKCDKPDFTFNYGQNKKVRVVLAGDIVPAKNYYLAHVQIVPEFVSVYANRHELEAIKTVLTENLNLSNISDTVVRVVNLRAIAGAKTVPAKVKVTLFPDVLTEGSADVPIVAVNKPRNLIIRTFPQTVKVRYTVGSMVYRLVKPSDFQVHVDYMQIADHPSDKCKLHLVCNSRFVREATLETPQVDYLIEQQ